VSRIEWGRYGADIEHVIGMLLCASNPDAQLIRPSQGDGGIDVLVPVDSDDRHIDVYQVKRFHEHLDSSQKGQIKESLRRLVSFTADDSYRVRNWYATMPLLRTNEYRDWLDEIAAQTGANFRCEWRGLHFIDTLAADHPKSSTTTCAMAANAWKPALHR
jgi:hypothetical protein